MWKPNRKYTLAVSKGINAKNSQNMNENQANVCKKPFHGSPKKKDAMYANPARINESNIDLTIGFL